MRIFNCSIFFSVMLTSLKQVFTVCLCWGQIWESLDVLQGKLLHFCLMFSHDILHKASWYYSYGLWTKNKLGFSLLRTFLGDFGPYIHIYIPQLSENHLTFSFEFLYVLFDKFLLPSFSETLSISNRSHNQNWASYDGHIILFIL